MIEEKKAFDSRTMVGLVTRLMEGRRRKKGKVESIGGSDHKDDSLFDIVVFGHCRPLDRAESKWQTVTRFRARPVRGLRIISLWWLAPLISRPNNRDRFMQIPTIASPPPPLSLSPRVEPSPLSPPRISFATIPEKNPLVPPIRPANAPVSLEATSYFELSMTLSFRRQMIATNSLLPSLSLPIVIYQSGSRVRRSRLARVSSSSWNSPREYDGGDQKPCPFSRDRIERRRKCNDVQEGALIFH